MNKERKGKGARSGDSQPPDLRKERDEFLQNFSRGARLTEEFVQEQQRLQRRLGELEEENAKLRATLEADHAVRELLDKIELLERDKRELLSRFRDAERQSTDISERFQEVENEFANLANLFVASNQLHSSLSPRGVMRRVKEVLAQLVGAERYGVYLLGAQGDEVVPIASEGVPGERLAPLRVEGRLAEVLRTGGAFVEEDGSPADGGAAGPVAIVPLRVDERTVGVIVIFSTLTQKTHFDTVDFELFKLLGQHAASALVAASLFEQAERKIPGLEAFIDLSV
ncbi:MAG: GAF domain-containing protein [Sorangiineae bacterium]|nr:GAF domain-containing protein [Polyangiaceae bacterium]MEB2323279.1 GAF domain-containing protein [Sorangiineae bacterium]